MSGFWYDKSANGRGSYDPGNQPCKFVALHANTAVQKEEKGIEQIEFEDQDDTMKRMYAEECAKNGVTVDMG
jgi:hypothetical protein